VINGLAQCFTIILYKSLRLSGPASIIMLRGDVRVFERGSKFYCLHEFFHRVGGATRLNRDGGEAARVLNWYLNESICNNDPITLRGAPPKICARLC